jgi:hypothetical protein
MRLLLFAIILAVSLGYATGGRLKRLETLKLRWWLLALLGLLLQIPPPDSLSRNTGLETALLWVSFACLITFAFRNLQLRGFVVIIAGLVCNFAVIAANNGMPVSAAAVKASGQGSLLVELQKGQAAKHHLQKEGDVLVPLADEIPIGWPINQVVSLGDILVYTGMIWVIASVMRKGLRVPGPARRRGGFRVPRLRSRLSDRPESRPSGTGPQS